MRRLERLGDLPCDRNGVLDRHGPAADAIGKILARRQFHGEKVDLGLPVGISLADLVDPGNVRVVQLRQQLGLTLESGQALGVGDERVGQHFDRHLALEPGVLGSVDGSHSAFTELGGDLEVRQSLADQGEGILSAVPAKIPPRVPRLHRGGGRLDR